MIRHNEIPYDLQKEFNLFIKDNVTLERDDKGNVTSRTFPAFLERVVEKDEPVFISTHDKFSGLRNSNWVMPLDICKALGLPLGAVYSNGVRVLINS